MALKIKQIVYYGNGDSKNSPTKLTIDKLTSSESGIQKILNISTGFSSIGIQGKPGMRYYIPYSDGKVQELSLNELGIETYDLSSINKISNIYFNEEDIDKADFSSEPLLIDILY